jgi:O-succinylbenzoic acid--CoA ligase
VRVRITALGADPADGANTPGSSTPPPADSDPDSEWNRRDALPGETGRIEISTLSLFRGFRDFAGSGRFMPHNSPWLVTSDLGFLDPETLKLVVVGRSDDLIITGGHKVWPHPVEMALGQLPSVADVAVAGTEDPTWGQAVTAFVVPADPSSPPTLGELRSAVKESMPAHAAPHRLCLMERIPRTTLGKVMRRSLPEVVSRKIEGDISGE